MICQGSLNYLKKLLLLPAGLFTDSNAINFSALALSLKVTKTEPLKLRVLVSRSAQVRRLTCTTPSAHLAKNARRSSSEVFSFSNPLQYTVLAVLVSSSS